MKTAGAHRDYTGAKIGMWLFLFTEFFLFFGPVLLYSVFRLRYPAEFLSASMELDLHAGALNTVVLLTSSLSMAAAVTALQRGRRGAALVLLFATFAFGAVFMANKYLEWGGKIAHGIYPGAELGAQGRAVFYGLYFFTTGLHGLHVLAGMGVVAFMWFLVYGGRVHADDQVKLENAGLYWHLVDLVWIYLFPIFYLVR